MSSDLNPTENVGSMLKHHVRNQRIAINSRQNLITALTAAYEDLRTNREYFIRLLQSMPNRLREVQHSEGGHTSYWILFIFLFLVFISHELFNFDLKIDLNKHKPVLL